MHDVKTKIHSKALRAQRSAQLGYHSHYARTAALALHRQGLIDSTALACDMRIHQAGNRAKHDSVKNIANMDRL